MRARNEQLLFFALSACVFVYLVLRAALVPLTHDEAATFQTYVLSGNYLPYCSHWDAGNHLLITAIGRACYLVFGMQPLALRCFEVLTFILYAVYAWRFARMIEHPLVRWCAALALLLTPFNIEFFALFRGYGPSLAFLLMALFHLVRFAQGGGRWQLVWTLSAICLGTYASLSLLIVYGLTVMLTAAMVARNDHRDARSWSAWVLFGLAPLLFAAIYAEGLSSRELLYFGTREGLLNGSLPSLAKWVFGIEHPAMGAVMLCCAIVVSMFAIALDKKQVILVLLFLLVGELIGRVVLGVGFDVLYPQDRTAMHWVPIIILLFAFALDRAVVINTRLRWVSLVLLWLPLRTIAHINIDHTMYWPEQAIPDEVFELAEARQARSARPLLIGGYRQNPAAWAYGCALRGGKLNFMDVDGFPQPTCDLLIIDTTYFTVPPGFRTLFTARSGRLNLMERTDPLRISMLDESTRAIAPTDEEFVGLWPTSDSTSLTEEQLVEIDALLRSDREVLQLRVVVEVKDSSGEGLHYDVDDIERLRSHWQGDRLRVLKRIPAFPGKRVRTAIYFWNPNKQSFSADTVRVKMLEVQP